MPTLYLVGTPIGNLEDISLRALRILNQVDLIAAEDTRKTGRLLKHYDIETPLTSYHDFSKQAKVDRLIGELENKDVALVSDAGMPGLSDPGYRLVKAAIDAGFKVEPIPGPSAVVTALVSSGLPTDRYEYLGFFPRQSSSRLALLQDVASSTSTLVVFEAPHRLLQFLEEAYQVLGDRRICIAREVTKLHEEFWRGSIKQALAHFSERTIKGELTIVVEGDPTLFNQYGIILVNPEKHPHVKADLGQAFIDWVLSEKGQQVIGDFQIKGNQAFFPNAGGQS